VVPHSHSGDISYSNESLNIETVDSFLDLVKVAFLIDLGEGHMDNYHFVDGPEDVSIDLFSDLFQGDLFNLSSKYEIQEIISERSIFFQKSMHPPRIYLDSYKLRGPPLHTIG